MNRGGETYGRRKSDRGHPGAGDIAPGFRVRKRLDAAHAQRLRMHRLRLAFIGYLVMMAVLAYLWWDGQLAFSRIGFLSLVFGAMLMNAFFAALILSGRNLVLRDPSMTGLQISGLVVIALVIGWGSRSLVAQDAAAMSLIVGLLFSMFRLFSRRMLLLAALSFVAFAATVLFHDQKVGLNFNDTIPWLVIVGSTMIWATLFASYVGRLRQRLRDRNAELRHALAKLERLAKHDALTGIYNRREIFRQLVDALEEGRPAGSPVSISLFDLDGFKGINDKFGHGVGDQALREFAARVKSTVRALDLFGRIDDSVGFGRYGGEEFLLVMPMTTLEGAQEAAERFRRAVSDSPLVIGDEQIRISVSQGVAEAGQDESMDHLLARADRALYRAKREGRNRVCIAGPMDTTGEASGDDFAGEMNFSGMRPEPD